MNATTKDTARTIVSGAITGAKAGAVASLPMGAPLHLGALATQSAGHAAFATVSRAFEAKTGIAVYDAPNPTMGMVGSVGSSAAAGAVFGAASSLLPARARTTATSTALGAMFGVALWAVRAAGWLPKLRVLPSSRHNPNGNKLLTAIDIGSHAMWGAGLGAAVGRAAAARNSDVIDMKAGA